MGPGWSAADKHRQRGCPRRCGCRLQPDRTDQGKDDHPRSSERTRGLPNAHEGAIHAPKIFTTLRTGMMIHSIDNLAQRGIAYVPFFPLGGFNPLQSATLDGVADSLGATPTQVALAWLLLRSPNILLIPGTSSVQHLRANLQAATLTLPSDTLAKLEALGTKSEQTSKDDI